VEELGERVKHLRDLISVLLGVASVVLLVLLPFGVRLPDEVGAAINAIVASAVIFSVVYSLTRRRNSGDDSKSK
jgi:predicted secreted protein